MAIGNGMLLFEAIKGVNKKFHSCHEQVLIFYQNYHSLLFKFFGMKRRGR